MWTGWRLRAKAGQRLTLKRPLHGVRSYLAVAGIDVPEVLGSSSTDQKAAAMKDGCCATAIVCE